MHKTIDTKKKRANCILGLALSFQVRISLNMRCTKTFTIKKDVLIRDISILFRRRNISLSKWGVCRAQKGYLHTFNVHV